MKLKNGWIFFVLACLTSGLDVRGDYVANMNTPDAVNDFRHAAVGSVAPLDIQSLWTFTNNHLRIAGRYRNIAGRYLYVSDDGAGSYDGRYRTNVTASMAFRYYSSSALVPDSTNTFFFMGLRSQTNINFRNTPTYRIAITNNIFVLHKDFNWSVSPLVLTNATLPYNLGRTNIYRIVFSATESGTNSFGEIVDLSVSLFENGSFLSELTYQDVPTNAAIANPGASRPDGYMGFAAGQEWTNTQDGAWRGVDILEYSVRSNPQDATLSLSGHDAMSAGMTNWMSLVRGGEIADTYAFNLNSSDAGAATVPESVDIGQDSWGSVFPVVGAGFGLTTISATNEYYPGVSTTVMVFDVAYDDASYAQQAGAFVVATNARNSGGGFQSWIIQQNATNTPTYTNYAGIFLGSSIAGGVNVNVQGRSFGLFANKSGTAGDAPYVNAIRPFNQALEVGQTVSVNLGVNYLNGSKGMKFQNSGTPIFEIAVYGDKYWYKIGTNEPVDMTWAYAADSKISILFNRAQDHLYDISIEREGSAPELLDLGVVDLGYTPPNELLFYNYNTDSGLAENNLYVNRLAIYSGNEMPVLSIQGRDGLVTGQTNAFTVSRTGPTDSTLTVNLSSDPAGVVDLPASVDIEAGQSNATFAVAGVSNNLVTIFAQADDAIEDDHIVAVVDIAYDDTTYYPPAVFEPAGNGGQGFQPWVVSVNDGPGEGFTNYVGTGIGDSSVANGNINSSEGNAFLLYANGDGTDANAPLAQASRDFTTLGVGESISVDLGVNYRNGAKGVVFQSGDTWLFEFAVFNDTYNYNVRDLGGDSPVDLGWDFAGDSAINVVLSRTGANSYNARFMRTGSSETQTLLQAISLSQAPDRMRLYVYDTDAGGDENNLYFNRLIQFTGIVGEASTETDGIPNSWWDRYGITGTNRVASANPDGDAEDNHNEYVADTNPTDPGSVFPNLVSSLTGGQAMTLQTGPTTNSRIYDVWWTTNLMANPQEWTRYGLDVTGNGGTVNLQVTNDAPMRVYRTGVALPVN